MRQATVIIKLWNKDRKANDEYRCYFEPQESGIEVIRKCDDNEILGYFDPERSWYSFSDDKSILGYAVHRITVTEMLSNLLSEMKSRIRKAPEIIQTSGRKKVTTDTLF